MKSKDSNGVLGINGKKGLSNKNLLSIQSIEEIEEVEKHYTKDKKQQSTLIYDTPQNMLLKTGESMRDNISAYLNAKDSKNINKKQNIYVSVGDINGIGLELILRNHHIISQLCEPIYCISMSMLKKASNILQIPFPNDINIYDIGIDDIDINPGEINANSGYYSFKSFSVAVELSMQNNCPIITLPIHKYAWNLAGINYIGHTQYLRNRFQKDAIMMLGSHEMFVALYTDHIPLREVVSFIKEDLLLHFFREFYYSFVKNYMVDSLNIKNNLSKDNNTIDKNNDLFNQIDINQAHNIESQINAIKEYALNPKMVKRLIHDSKAKHISEIDLDNYNKKPFQVAVLGVNPHAGDNGILGNEDLIIKDCINKINAELQMDIFVGPLAPDSAFIPDNRKKYKIFIAMYHDSGLSPLKALYFDRSINVSLNLPILRASPDHGTCFDKAYKKDSVLNMKSYIESFKFIVCNVANIK